MKAAGGLPDGGLNRFIAASGLANLGDGIALIAWAWLATHLTRDPLLIAMVPVALKAPWFVFSLPAGIIVDRFDRRRLIMMADGLRALAYLGAAIAVWASLPFEAPPLRGTDQPGLLVLIAAAAITVGIAEVLRDTSAQTMLPALVPSASLERANGRLWSFEFVMNNFVGTAVAGILLGMSMALPFGVNAAVMVLALALVAGLKGDFRAPRDADAAQTGWREDLREGVSHVLTHPILRRLALLTGFFNFGFEAMMVTLVLIVQERLQLGPMALSAIMASGAVGGIAAGLVNDRLVARIGAARALQGAMIATLLLPLCVIFGGTGVSGLLIICAGFVVTHFWGVLWNTVSVSYRQRSVSNRLLGRVNSSYRLFAIGMAPLGMLAAGLLTRFAGDLVGRPLALSAPYLLALIVFGVLTLIYWRFLGRGLEWR